MNCQIIAFVMPSNLMESENNRLKNNTFAKTYYKLLFHNKSDCDL